LEEAKRAHAEQEGKQESRIASLEESLRKARESTGPAESQMEEARAGRERAEAALERLQGERDAAQRAFDQERSALQERLRQMEADMASRGGAAEAANAERARIEERATMVQKALDTLEQQLRDERDAAAEQIRKLEAERDQVRAKSAQLETRVGSLIEELGSRRPRKKGEKARAPEPEPEESNLTTRAEARIQTLESELATSRAQLGQDKQSTATRIQKLESRWEELKARLLPKDREISDLRQQTEQLRTQVQQLEASLAEERKNAEAVSEKQAEAEQSPEGILALSSERAAALYHQSMARLTVLMASADIVLMNPRLEAGLRDSTQEIKTQSQALLDLIKSFTLPAEGPKSS
jgi:chromosome segregation ATPase